MVTIEVDEDNMEEIADEAATLYLTSMLSEWGAYYWAKSLPRFVSYDSLNPFFSFWACPQPKDKTVFVVQVNQVFCFLRGYDWLPVGLWHLTMDAPENSWEPICNLSNPSLASVALATAMGSTHGKEHHVTIKYVHSHKN